MLRKTAFDAVRKSVSKARGLPNVHYIIKEFMMKKASTAIQSVGWACRSFRCARAR